MLAYGATTAFLPLAFNVVVLAYGSTTTFIVLAFLAVLLAYGAYRRIPCTCVFGGFARRGSPLLSQEVPPASSRGDEQRPYGSINASMEASTEVARRRDFR